MVELLCKQLTFAQGEDDNLLICTLHAIGNMASCSEDTIINELVHYSILSRLHGLLKDENEQIQTEALWGLSNIACSENMSVIATFLED